MTSGSRYAGGARRATGRRRLPSMWRPPATAANSGARRRRSSWASSSRCPATSSSPCTACSNGSEEWCQQQRAVISRIARPTPVCRLGAGGPVATQVGYTPLLQNDQKVLAVDVAVARGLAAREVFVEWSDDGWRTKQRTPCIFARRPLGPDRSSSATRATPTSMRSACGRRGCASARRTASSMRFGCVTPAGERWDNNARRNYAAPRRSQGAHPQPALLPGRATRTTKLLADRPAPSTNWIST